MAKKSFHTTIKVNAPAQEAVNKISQVNKWWATKFNEKSEKLNDNFTVDFGKPLLIFKSKN